MTAMSLKQRRRRHHRRAWAVTVLIFAVAGLLVYTLSRHPHHAAASSPPLPAPIPAATTTTTTVPVATTVHRPVAPKHLAPTRRPVAVPGGTFTVVHGKVTLTHVVVHGDTLFGVAHWFKLTGGTQALYDWNRSTVGRNANLIFPGEKLSITVPAATIPHISPVWLHTTVQGA